MPKIKQNYSTGNCRMHVAIAVKLIQKLFGIPKDLLLSKSRKGVIIRYRSMIYNVVYNNDTSCTLEEIGFHMGGKDHATVLNGKRAHESFCISETEYVEKYVKFKEAFDNKVNGVSVEDDSVLEMIKKIESIENDLEIVKTYLIKNYSNQRDVDPAIREKIISIPNINTDEERAILERDIASGINIPASNEQL